MQVVAGPIYCKWRPYSTRHVLCVCCVVATTILSYAAKGREHTCKAFFFLHTVFTHTYIFTRKWTLQKVWKSGLRCPLMWILGVWTSLCILLYTNCILLPIHFCTFSFLIYELVLTLPLDECIIMIYNNNNYYNTIVITIFKLYISHACIGR